MRSSVQEIIQKYERLYKRPVQSNEVNLTKTEVQSCLVTYHGHLASYLKTQDQNLILKLGFIFHFYNWPPSLRCTVRVSNTLRWFSYLILPLESLSLFRELFPEACFLLTVYTPFVLFRQGLM